MMVWFVIYYLHNGKNDGWAYKVVNKYNTRDAAEKAFYSEYSSYIGGDTYDYVTMLFTDSLGNPIETKHWEKDVPVPEPDESEE